MNENKTDIAASEVLGLSTCALIGIHMYSIGNDWNNPIFYERMLHKFSNEMGIPRVIWMNGKRSIAKHSLQTSGCNWNSFLSR